MSGLLENNEIQPMFIVTVPKALAAGMRKSMDGTPQGTIKPVGLIVSKEPYVPGKSHQGNFKMSLKTRWDGKTQKFIMKGEKSRRSERILAHERTTDDQYMPRSNQEKFLLPKKRNPEEISFKGVVSHNCKIIPDARDTVSLLEMGRRLEAKRQKIIAEKIRRKAKSVSIREQPRPERNQGMISLGAASSSSSSSSLMTATQISRQEGMKEQYEVKLDDSKIRKILIQYFREKEAQFVPDLRFTNFPGLRLKVDIKKIMELKHQKEKFIKKVLSEIAYYHTEAGDHYQRWTLKESLK